ncbi:carbohydrate-binding protein [Corynebacterium sp. KPL2825]|uniref:carbohydrate-binding protein n=1 Tax=Corynebacterium sp. KPL2825 TaxID=3135444 RepID=UPI0030C9874A
MTLQDTIRALPDEEFAQLKSWIVTIETEPEISTEQPAAPAFKQPSGSHDAYKQGDRVTYNGAVYESTIPNNVWSPSDYPQGWKKL